MAYIKLKRYRLRTSYDAEKINTLHVGDVVKRQYFDGTNVISTIMYVEEVGFDIIQTDEGEKRSNYFVGSVMYGDAPKQGELFEFSRITNLIDPDRSGALYLTASDSESPYMDVIDGFTKNNAIFSPSYIGDGGYESLGGGVEIDYSINKDDRYRLARYTNKSNPDGIGLLHNTGKEHTGVWFLSFRINSSKRSNFNVKITGDKAVDINEKFQSTSTPTVFFIPVTTDMIGSSGRKIEISFSELNSRGDYFEISDLSIVDLHTLNNLSAVSKTRIGKLDGLYDGLFGDIKGYGAYLENLYAANGANIAGTLVAGDRYGSDIGFYAGQIHTNAFINSIDIRFKNDTQKEIDEKLFDIGKVYKITGSESTLIAQSSEWSNKNNGKEYCFSIYVKSDIDQKISILTSKTKHTFNVKSGDGWRRLSFSFMVEDGDNEISILGSNVIFTSPQLELGDKHTLYQPTDSELNYSGGYGAWFIRGGIGGTIQNPLLKLNDDGSIESKGSGFKINSDGTGHLAGGAITFTEDRVNVSFDDSNIGKEIKNETDRLDGKIDSEVDRLETNFEIKEGQISSSVEKIESIHKDVVNKHGDVVEMKDSVSQTKTSVEQTADSVSSMASEVEINYGKVTEETIKSAENAKEAQEKANLAKIEAENAKISAGESSQSYLDAKAKAEAAQEEADRAKDEADRAAMVGADVTDKYTEINQTAEQINLVAEEVSKSIIEVGESAEEARIEADRASKEAEEARIKAQEALESAGESSAQYQKAKEEADKAELDAIKAKENADKASDTYIQVVNKKTEIDQTAEHIMSTASEVDVNAKLAKDSAEMAAASEVSVTEKQTEINQTAEEISSTASKVSVDASNANKSAQEAANKASQAEIKAQEAAEEAANALESAGKSSQSYLDAKEKADLAAQEAESARLDADKAAKALLDVSSKQTEINQTAEEISSKATMVEGLAASASKDAESAQLKAKEAADKAAEAQLKAKEALESAGASSAEYKKAKAEAEKAVAEADKAADSAGEANAALGKVIEAETNVTQTAEEVNITASKVSVDAATATKKAAEAKNEADKASLEAIEATKKAEEALASAGASSAEYKKALAEANKAKAQAELAASKASEANSHLENVKKLESSVSITAEGVSVNAVKVSESVKHVDGAVIEAQESATSAASKAAEAELKAELAQEEAEKALNSAGESSASYLKAKAEADKAAADALKAKEDAAKAAEEAENAENVHKEIIIKYNEINETAEGIEIITGEAKKAANEATEAANEAQSQSIAAKIEAEKAKADALEAAAQAKEALLSAGESSESYLKAKERAEEAASKADEAKSKAEEAAKDAKKAEEEALKALEAQDDISDKYTKIIKTAEEIELLAHKAEDYANKAIEAEASINLKADGIVMEASQKAADKAIDELDIGARNLFLNGDFSSQDVIDGVFESFQGGAFKFAEKEGLTSVYIDVSANKFESAYSSAYGGAYRRSNSGIVTPNTSDNFSEEIKKGDVVSHQSLIYSEDGLDIIFGIQGTKYHTANIPAKQWTLIKVEGEEIVDDEPKMYWFSRNKENFYLTRVKVERGSKCTGWLINPDDTIKNLKETKATLKVLNDSIEASVKTIDELSGRVDETELKLEPDNIWMAVKSTNQFEQDKDGVLSSINMTEHGIDMFGKQLRFDGLVTIGMIKDGDDDNTIINNGKIKTNLLEVEQIVAQGISAEHIDGLTLNFQKGKIGGWNIGSSSISKNNVSLRSDGSIANGSKWALYNDGSGLLASGNIKWNSSGVVSIASAVKIGSSNLDDTVISDGTIVSSLINANEIVTNGLTAEHISGKEIDFVKGTIGGFIIGEKTLQSKQKYTYRDPNNQTQLITKPKLLLNGHEGSIDIISGSIGGFEIGQHMIGAKDNLTHSLHMTNDFFQVGSEHTYVSLGSNTVPPSIGELYKISSSFFSEQNRSSGWETNPFVRPNINVGSAMYASGADFNYGVWSDAAIMTPAVIENECRVIKEEEAWMTYSFNFAQHSKFIVTSSQTRRIDLPSKQDVMRMFDIQTTMKDDFFAVFTILFYGSGKIILDGVMNNNGNYVDYDLNNGDVIVIAAVNWGGFHYQTLHYRT